MELRATWFGFELNHLQSVLLLALAFIGLLNIPFGLLLGVKELLDAIFISIPAHLAHPAWYTIYYVFDDFKSAIIDITIYSIFFTICVYTIRKIVKNNHRSIFKHTSSQEQITSWFGFKLNHSQSILLFSLSLVGIISISASLIRGLETYPYSIFFNDLFPNWNRNIQRGLFVWLHLTIIAISLYTIIKMKMNYKGSHSELEMHHPTSFVIIFIVSLIIVIFIGFKLLTLLYLPMNSNDFFATLLVLLGSSNLASFLFLRKRHNPRYKPIPSSSNEQVRDIKKNSKLSKFKLILLLVFIFAFTVIYFDFFTRYLGLPVFDNYFFFFLIDLQIFYGETYFLSLLASLFSLLLISIPFFVLFYLFISKGHLERNLKELEIAIEKKWMDLHVKLKSFAILFYWISLTQLVFLLVYLFALLPYILNTYSGYYEFFKNLLLVIIIGMTYVYCLYNLTKFYYVQKLRGKAIAE